MEWNEEMEWVVEKQKVHYLEPVVVGVCLVMKGPLDDGSKTVHT